MKKQIISILIFVFIASVIIITIRSFTTSVFRNQDPRPVQEWKTSLKPVGFKGVVSNKQKFSFTDRNMFKITVRVIDISNLEAIPKQCDFFEYEKGSIEFAAYSETVNRWEHYGLEEGYLIEKKVSNDTLFVYTPDGKPKYVFEIFDGIANEWIPRKWPKADL